MMKIQRMSKSLLTAVLCLLPLAGIAQYTPKTEAEAQLTQKLLVVENVRNITEIMTFSFANPVYGNKNELLSIELVGFQANANGYFGYQLMPRASFSFQYANDKLASVVYNENACSMENRDYRINNGEISGVYSGSDYCSTTIDKATLIIKAKETDMYKTSGSMWSSQETIVECFSNGTIKSVKEFEVVRKGKDRRSAIREFSYCTKEKTFDENNPNNFKLLEYDKKEKAKDPDILMRASNVEIQKEGNKVNVTISDLVSKTTKHIIWTYNDKQMPIRTEMPNEASPCTISFEYNELGFISKMEVITKNAQGGFESHTQSELNYVLNEGATAGSYPCSYKLKRLDRNFDEKGEATSETFERQKRTKNADGSWGSWVQMGY